MNKLLLIIPAYNEEESLPLVIDHLKKYPYDFVVINDGSRDNTGPLCRKLGVKCIDLPFNMGLAGAFQTGVSYAHARGYECAMQFDADGQHLPEYIGDMLAHMQKYADDVVIGSRYVNQKQSGSLRSVGMRLIRLLIHLTTGKKITDPTSGMRLYNKKMINLFATNINYGPEPDTLAYLIKNGVKVSEVSVRMEERIAGQSYLRMWSSIRYMCRMIISILLIQFVRPRLKKEEI